MKFKKLIILILIIFFYNNVFSEQVQSESQNPKNYCHQEDKNSDWIKTLQEYPNDPIIIKLFALRKGLCTMIDMKLISLERGIDLFEEERQKLLFERQKEKYNKTFKIPS